MDGKTLARIGAIVFVAFAITATVIEMARKDDVRINATERPPLAAPAKDPLRAELVRCSQAGEAATRDPSCLQVWDRNRRRFLGEPQAGR